MAMELSNGFDAGKGVINPKSNYSYETDNESFSFEAEASAKISATATESCKINNTYEFNLALPSFAMNVGIKDTTNIGATWTVSCDCPTFDCVSSIVAPECAESKLKKIKSKSCVSYKYIETIHHRGESLSLRAHKEDDPAIDAQLYGTQDIKLTGGQGFSIKAGDKEKGSLTSIQAIMSAMVTAQIATLAGGCINHGSTGAAGFRGNVSCGTGVAAAIAGGAAFIALMPMIALWRAGKSSPAYDANNLKGPNGSGTPNDKGILFDACEPTDGGKFTAKGTSVELAAASRVRTNSSLKLDSNGTILMKGSKCSLETDDNGGQASIMLDDNSFVCKANAGATADSELSITSAVMKIQHNNHEIKLMRAVVEADSLKITKGGVLMPGITITSTGVVNHAP